MKKNKQFGQKFAGLMDRTAILNLAVFPKSPLPIPNLLLKKARMYIGNFEILRASLCKIIKSTKKDKSEPGLDSTEKNQALFLLEDTNHHADSKNSKKKLISDYKPMIRLVLIRKPLSWFQCQKYKNIDVLPLSWYKDVES